MILETFLCMCMCVCVCVCVCVSHSVASNSLQCHVACQAPLSMEFCKQEYRSGLPFSSPGDLPDPGIEPTSLALAGEFFTNVPSGKPNI